MVKLIRLLRQYSNVFLFITLLIIAVNLIARQNRVQSVDIINSSNAIVGVMYKLQNDVVSYFQLRSINKELLAENAALRNLEARYMGIDTFQEGVATLNVSILDTSKVVKPIEDSLALKDSSRVDTASTPDDIAFDKEIIYTGERKVVKSVKYSFIPARVINNSIAKSRMNFITINRGNRDGVKKNMAVISSNGIVGRVSSVSAHFATVLSVLSEGRTYNAQLRDGTEGLFTWDLGSSNSVTISKIPKIIRTKIGDTVYTSGYSLFPEGMMMGTIAAIDTPKAGSSKNVKVLLSTNFRKLNYVYVIKDELAEERTELENKSSESTEKQ